LMDLCRSNIGGPDPCDPRAPAALMLMTGRTVVYFIGVETDEDEDVKRVAAADAAAGPDRDVPQ